MSLVSVGIVRKAHRSDSEFINVIAAETDQAKEQIYLVREGVNGKKTFSFGHCPNKGGGVYPCPNFLAPFFYQVIVLKIAFF